MGAQIGIGQRRHVDVGNGAEELHGLGRAPKGAIEDLLGRAEADHWLLGQAHQLDQGGEGLGTVLAGEGPDLLERVGAPGGIA
jgi:hypothetical protein